MPTDTLSFDFDALTVGEIDFLEDTLNEKLRDVLGDRIVTFNDVIENFKPRTEGGKGPLLVLPVGKIMRVMAWMQLRKEDPAATWEQAGDLKLKMEVVPPKDGETILAEAVAAANLPVSLDQAMLTTPPFTPSDNAA